ncbi:lupus La protein [Tanacetum coccineum]
MVWISSNGVDNEFFVSIAWDTIRPRGDVVNWHDLVWFSHAIPRHAFHLWLVIKRKLKTQDVLRQWDVSSNTNLNLLRCPLCGLQPDSHDHLFFECVFSSQVWDYLKTYAGIPNAQANLDPIISLLIMLPKKRSARSVIAKLVFAASSYFIWQERNSRLFANQRRSKDRLIEVIKTTVRLKLLTCRFKRTPSVEVFFTDLEVTFLSILFISLMDSALMGCWCIEDLVVRVFEVFLKLECPLRIVLFFSSP